MGTKNIGAKQSPSQGLWRGESAAEELATRTESLFNKVLAIESRPQFSRAAFPIR